MALTVFTQNSTPKPVSGLWSPSDKGFSILTPGPLQSVPTEAAKDDEQEFLTKSELFGLEKEDCIFAVYRLTLVPKEARKSFQEKLGGLEYLIVKGNYDFSRRTIKLNGLDAIEIVYDVGTIRGLLVDAGDKVFVIATGAEDKRFLDSRVARDFLESFRLLK